LAQQTLTLPTQNTIYVAGKAPIVFEARTSSANVQPGMLLKKGTNAFDVDVCAAGDDPIGWAAYDETDIRYKPADIDTAYAEYDLISVLAGRGFVIRGILITGENASLYDMLTAATGGKVKVAATMTVAEDAATHHIVSTGAVSGNYPADGMVVGRVVGAAVNATSADKPVAVLSYL
jgi:hypothetical protein